MKINIVRSYVCLSALLLIACGGQNLESKNGFTVLPVVQPGERVATFAGGCFWAMQECMIELKGVHTAVSGYAGGTTANPTYEEVLTQKTGHAESVQVYYDPTIISFEQLAKAFFNSHDPTQIDRQGPDVGTDYRSIAFYRTPAERAAILKIINSINSTAQYPNAVATELMPFSVFYPAEIYHQDYYRRNRLEPYIRNVSRSKVLKLRKTMPELIKEDYQ